MAIKNDIKLCGEAVSGLGDSRDLIKAELLDGIGFEDLKVLKTDLNSIYVMLSVPPGQRR